MANTATINGIKIYQFNHQLVVGAIKASDLVSLYNSGIIKPDLYKKGTREDGYQRNLLVSRSRSFAKSPPASHTPGFDRVFPYKKCVYSAVLCPYRPANAL